jgi:hypothetical protein
MFKWMRSRRPATGDGDEAAGLDRRKLLRLGGMAAVGTAGAAVVSVAGAPAADAAAGAKVVLGASNDAGTSVTTLRSATTAEALRVSNVADGGAIRADSTPTATGVPRESSVVRLRLTRHTWPLGHPHVRRRRTQRCQRRR